MYFVINGMVFGKYGNMGRSILNRDSSIRFVTIFDTRNEGIVFSEHQPGATNLLSREESQESLQLAIDSWKMRSKLAPKIGNGKVRTGRIREDKKNYNAIGQ